MKCASLFSKKKNKYLEFVNQLINFAPYMLFKDGKSSLHKTL